MDHKSLISRFIFLHPLAVEKVLAYRWARGGSSREGSVFAHARHVFVGAKKQTAGPRCCATRRGTVHTRRSPLRARAATVQTRIATTTASQSRMKAIHKDTKISSSSSPPQTRTMMRLFSTIEQDLEHDLSASTVVDVGANVCGGGGGDTASLVTESSSSSEAVVSLFNCWSSVEEVSPFHGVQNSNDDSELQKLAGLTVISITTPMEDPTTTTTTPEEVLRRLTKRLRPDDMPTIPLLKRRKRPTCCFINYLGPARLHDHHAKCGLSSTNLLPIVAVVAAAVVPTTAFVPASHQLLPPQHEPNEMETRIGNKHPNNDDADHHNSSSWEGGAFCKSPDLGATFSPADVGLEELDLLEPLFADEDDDADENDSELLFPMTTTAMMSKASFPMSLLDCDDNMDDVDLQIMVRWR
jgi:hypothetical protein